MKREIKFKAKRLDNSEWVIGFYTNIQDKEHYILTPCAIGLVHIEVDRETVCQYTGRQDKTKVDVYEDDTTDAGVVYYSDKYLGFFLKSKFDNQPDTPLYDEPLIIVTGNIHDQTTADNEN